MNQKFWKQYGEWVTAFLEKFQHDVLFRIQVVFIAVLILIIAIDLIALSILSKNLVSEVFQNDLEQLLRLEPSPALTSTVLDGKSTYTSTQIFMIAAGISTTFFIVLGFIAAHILLSPIRKAVYVQRNFISQIAHELRTPLSIARTNVEVTLLQKERLNRAELVDELEFAITQIDKVAGIIDNLATLNTLSRLRLEEYRQHNLNEILDEVIGLYSNFIENKNLTIQVQCEPDLLVWCNRNALIQMGSNIISNALNYTPSGGAVSISAYKISDTFVRLTVADSGIGIPREELKFVFKPFFRSRKKYSEDRGGSGLGLSIVRELVRLHAGRVGIQSVEGEGTTVTIDLPIKQKRIPVQPKTISDGLVSEIDFDYKMN
jgi:signal transduction histidine kinase